MGCGLGRTFRAAASVMNFGKLPDKLRKSLLLIVMAVLLSMEFRMKKKGKNK